MADITLTCSNCGKENVFSEFVDENLLVCRTCGTKLQKTAAPEGKSAPATPRKLRPSLQGVTAVQAQPDATVWQDTQQKAREAAPKEKKGVGQATKAFLLFLLLGSIAGAFRYGGFVPQHVLKAFTPYEPMIVALLYVLIILRAFKDSMFQGVLCFFIPIYPFYYLFSVSDDFYLRAVIAAILIATAQDSAVFYQQGITYGINYVNEWIASGG